MKYKNFILDIDGVLTDGKMIYSNKGKMLKTFGADDSDALKFLSEHLNISFITSDKRGFPISKKRISDMKFKVKLLHTKDRLTWIEKNFDLKKTIFMGDGIFDHIIMKKVGYAITVKNALQHVRKNANYITLCDGSDRAVAEASIHIAEKFLKIDFENIKELNFLN